MWPPPTHTSAPQPARDRKDRTLHTRNTHTTLRHAQTPSQHNTRPRGHGCSNTTYGPAQTRRSIPAKGEASRPATGVFPVGNGLQHQPAVALHARLRAGLNSRLSRRYVPTIIPEELWTENGLFQPILTLAQKSSKVTPQLGCTRTGAKQATLYPSTTNPLEAVCNLVPPDSLVSRRHRVATWGQDAKIRKIGHLGWPARVGIHGDLVRPSGDSRALGSPLVRCMGLSLAVTLAACCSARRWSRDGAENSKKGKIWQPGTHRKLHNSG